MTVLDAYAIIAYLRAEPSSAEVARLLRGPTQLTAVNAAEVCDQMVRVCGSDPDAVEVDLALVGHAGLALVPVSPEMAIKGGRIRAAATTGDTQRSALPIASPVPPRSPFGSRLLPPTPLLPTSSGLRAETSIRCPTARDDAHDQGSNSWPPGYAGTLGYTLSQASVPTPKIQASGSSPPSDTLFPRSAACIGRNGVGH
jgi:PIN domain nuclease of toxin-antitoxin system